MILMGNIPDTGWMFFLTVFNVLVSFIQCFEGCARQCFCNEFSQIVYCSRRGLSMIPEGIPRDALQINLNGNVFRNSRLQRANFSSYTDLEHLYLSECGLESIEVETFIDLSKLKWLDISNNRIRIIVDYTFRGTRLEHLFLNGNRNIQLRDHSFSGFETSGLYLHDCSLKKLQPNVLEQLNSTLKKLWLDGNELESLDRRLSPLFSTLSHLRLGSNPLHCNCEVVWLKEFYDKNGDIFKGAPPPSCLTPQKLRSKYFNALSLYDFRCQSPVFNNIDALFDHNAGRLRCTATGDPAPTLFWIRPSGESRRYLPPSDEEARLNEGVLSIVAGDDVLTGSDTVQEDDSDLSGMYICLALNEAGNVTLTLNVTWPGARGHGLPQATSAPPTLSRAPPTHSPSAERYPSTLLPVPEEKDSSSSSSSKPSNGKTSRSKPEVSNNRNNVDAADGVYVDNSNSKVNNKYNLTALNQMLDYKRRSGERIFNLTELVGAVIGTHVCTLILCIILMPIYLRRQWKRKQSTHGLEKSPNESLYLNGLSHADYFDTPSPAKR